MTIVILFNVLQPEPPHHGRCPLASCTKQTNCHGLSMAFRSRYHWTLLPYNAGEMPSLEDGFARPLAPSLCSSMPYTVVGMRTRFTIHCRLFGARFSAAQVWNPCYTESVSNFFDIAGNPSTAQCATKPELLLTVQRLDGAKSSE